ncbi:MAG: L-fucose/L-arabinose isomerase family protein [Actinobacteria bacterium]|nr:L-fucose/L-arabinose isomerase family protein [Actinomycetota bacterium]
MKKLRLGFIPSHRSFFNEDWAEKMRDRVVKVLDDIEDADFIIPDKDLIPNGVVRDPDDAKKVINLFKNSSIDGFIIGTMTFGDEMAAMDIVESFPNVPILLFGTKEGPFTPEGSRLSDSFCGTISIASGLNRRKIKFYFAGIFFPEEIEFIKNIKSFISTANIIKGFLKAKVGAVGPRPAPFETCSINEINLIERFKIRVIPVTLLEIKSAMERILDNDRGVKEIISDISESRIDCSTVEKNTLIKLSKLEIALRDFVKKEGLSCLALQCWSAIEETIGAVPCYVLGRLTNSGIPTACETDVYGALTMLIQYSAGLQKFSPHFMDWTIMHQEKENVFMSFHCGNAPLSLCSPNSQPVIRRHFLFEETLGKESSCGTCEFQLKEGPVILNRLTESECTYKMLITKGSVENENKNLRGSWSWVKVDNLNKLYRTIIEEGFTHHASMAYGDYSKEIENFCKFASISTVFV